jgi:hypothetical protein
MGVIKSLWFSYLLSAITAMNMPRRLRIVFLLFFRALHTFKHFSSSLSQKHQKKFPAPKKTGGKIFLGCVTLTDEPPYDLGGSRIS